METFNALQKQELPAQVLCAVAAYLNEIDTAGIQ
jgi:hypothetical protein